jgi:hypothetical protein
VASTWVPARSEGEGLTKLFPWYAPQRADASTRPLNVAIDERRVRSGRCRRDAIWSLSARCNRGQTATGIGPGEPRHRRRHRITPRTKRRFGNAAKTLQHFYGFEESGFDRDGEYPEQENMGKRGYFGNRESVAESWQRTKTDPFADSISLEWKQFAHNPAVGRG